MERSLEFLVNPDIPSILFEDDHLLVVIKPAGMNTHSPSPFAGEGIYEWLKNREPRWNTLSTIHRLDKDTSGVMVFGKTQIANRSLTDQFAKRQVTKKYLFLAAGRSSKDQFTIQSYFSRLGDKYISKPTGQKTDYAETTFTFVQQHKSFYLYQAEPKTGRTHQIRVHAAGEKLPILGDPIYGGAPFPRLALHAYQLRFRHPESGKWIEFEAPIHWESKPFQDFRQRLIAPTETTAFRLIHGGSDGHPGLYLEKWGDYFLAMSDNPLSALQLTLLRNLAAEHQVKGVYSKLLRKDVRSTGMDQAAPHLVHGEEAPETFGVLENSVRYRISFKQGYSVGLFLDQRDNRRRLLKNYIGPEFPLFRDGLAGKTVLNTFAYTCGFSVCAALAGAHVTSLDLSKKYLEWGKENFALNQLALENHDFIFGDVFEWFARFKKKGRGFDLILLDPPTFSKSKETGNFSAEKDYGKLAEAAFQLLSPHGALFASTNAAKYHPEAFASDIQTAAIAAKRKPKVMEFFPQPFDFPISKAEPAYLKTMWVGL
ncbi:MAG: pseudouridine synthase [Verrucomicrobiales bacterium]